MRSIKFRAWDKVNKCFIDFGPLWGLDYHVGNPEHRYEIMQFTGLKNKDGKDIYEGDIFRIEESTDGLDERFYVVIVWVHEWCMFCTLTVEERNEYLKDGIEALDEPSFWTYTLEHTDSRKHFLCGNIYENPELLTP